MNEDEKRGFINGLSVGLAINAIFCAVLYFLS